MIVLCNKGSVSTNSEMFLGTRLKLFPCFYLLQCPLSTLRSLQCLGTAPLYDEPAWVTPFCVQVTKLHDFFTKTRGGGCNVFMSDIKIELFVWVSVQPTHTHLLKKLGALCICVFDLAWKIWASRQRNFHFFLLSYMSSELISAVSPCVSILGLYILLYMFEFCVYFWGNLPFQPKKVVTLNQIRLRQNHTIKINRFNQFSMLLHLVPLVRKVFNGEQEIFKNSCW